MEIQSKASKPKVQEPSPSQYVYDTLIKTESSLAELKRNPFFPILTNYVTLSKKLT